MPNLRENIIEDFYLTPDYFEKDLNTKHGSGFQSNQNSHNQLISDFIINLNYMMGFILLELEPIQEQVFQECFPQQMF